MPVHVYRLAVTLPPGSDAPGWEPDCWTEWCDEHGWTGAFFGEDETYPTFQWARYMRRKKFLSEAAAERRARMLRAFGAEVAVERSDAVTWPTPVEVAAR